MSHVALSKEQARKIILHAAALAQPAPFGVGPEAVFELIDHLGYIQIDTNYVVERAHHHSIFSRVPDYRLEWLRDLQEDGRIYEFLTADSGFMPMHDFRFSLPVMESFKARYEATSKVEANLMEQVVDRIGREGPLMVSDFDNDRLEPSNGWWDWRPAKMALERLYFSGELLTTRAKDFRKLYDLPMNLIPVDVDTTVPTPEEYARHVIRRTLKALGIGYAKELAWRARFVKGNLVKKEVEKMAAEGELLTASIEGIKTATLYILPEYQHKEIELSGDAYILSPFDVLNVFRHRLKDFFNFDYQIECFVPAPKRKYGYFSLPVLIGDRFVARMDSKADRKKRELIIHNLHFEDVELTETDLDKLTGAICSYALFNQCRHVSVSKSNRENYLKAIRKGLQ